jgi:hypothetical protein
MNTAQTNNHVQLCSITDIDSLNVQGLIERYARGRNLLLLCFLDYKKTKSSKYMTHRTNLSPKWEAWLLTTQVHAALHRQFA